MNLWKRRDDSLDDEIRQHLDRLTDEHVEAGMSRSQARRAAERIFGRVLPAKEDTRAVWGWLWLERLAQDVRYGVRMMIRNPAFTAVAVLSMAIGIGANTAIFSFSDANLLRPLPVADPGGLFVVGSSTAVEGLGGSLSASYPDYVDIRDRSRTFGAVTAFGMTYVAFSPRAGEPAKVALGVVASRNFFDVAGVQPAYGRGFADGEDDVPGRDAVVVLGYEFWQRELGADRNAIGGQVWMNGQPFTVIGIAREGFSVDRLAQIAFYAPMMMQPALRSNPTVLEARSYRNLDIRARLAPGVSRDQAAAELQLLGKALEREHPATNTGRELLVRTELQNRLAQDPITSTLVTMLSALALVVLVVACANVGGLLASRAPVRAREVAMRLAIGAGRPRVVRQLITESLLIALAGGAGGLAIGYAGIRLFRLITVPTDTPIRNLIELDARVLAVSLSAAVLSAVVFGLLPAIRSTRTSLVAAMKPSDAPSVAGHRWGQSALVIGQVALSVALLVIALATQRAFGRELLAGPGYRIDHLIMMTVNPALLRYDEAQSTRFLEALLERARAMPTVRSAAASSRMPMAFNGGRVALVPEGYDLPPGTERINVMGARVDESYFDTMQIPVVAGRTFHRGDTTNAPLVAIVNELAARRYWPNGEAVGRRFRMNDASGPLVEIVGVARNSKYAWMAEPPTEFVYLPWRQHPQTLMTVVVESAGDPAALAAPLRAVVQSLDANMPLSDVRTMEEFYDLRAVRAARLVVQTVAAMGFMGLGLAIVGVYGLVAYAASRRTREIGIRMAIGADRRSVVRTVLRQGVLLGGIGVFVGLPGGLLVQRLMEAVFPAQSGFDLMPLAIVVPLVLGVTLLASYWPARRAADINVLQALRSE